MLNFSLLTNQNVNTYLFIEKDCNAETILSCELEVNDKKMIEVKF